MFGSVMLDVAIGLVLVYLILSLVCTSLREGIEAWFKHRSTFLHDGVCELLHDATLVKDLYEHPLISSLYQDTYEAAKDAKALPSYIPSRNFALAVLDMVARGRDSTQAAAAGPGATVLTVATLRQNIAQIRSPKVQRVVLSAIDLSGGELAKVQAAVETWFNSSMDRVSGWYKRRSQWILIWLGVGLAGVANIDTLRLAVSFYKDPSQRQAAVAMAGSLTKEPPAGTSKTGTDTVTMTEAKDLFAKLNTLKLPIGWPDPDLTSSNWLGWGLMKVFGWVITALAISLGAPFWFDILGKVMTVRSTLKPGSKGAAAVGGNEPPPSDASAPAAAAPIAAVGVGTHASSQNPAGGTPPGADYRPHEWASGHPETGVL